MADTVPPLATGPSGPDLPLDFIVMLAQVADPADVPNLRLVDKLWRSAVNQAAIGLRPSKRIQAREALAMCARFPRATALDLSNHTAIDSLPPRVATLRHLLTLSLGGCSALAALPIWICARLPELRSLDLRGCSALESLPECLGSLTSLQTLLLGGCSKLLALPDGIGGCSALETLGIGRCIALSALPEGIGRLGTLSTFNPIEPYTEVLDRKARCARWAH